MILWRIIVFACTAVLGLVGNILAVVVLVKHPGVMGESQRLIINQSVIDALASLFLFFSRGNIELGIGIALKYTDHWFFHFLCATWGHNAFLLGLTLASTYNLVFITTDRCLQISSPFWYRKHMTLTVTYSAITIAWLFGNLFIQIAWYELMEIDRTNFTCVENQDFLDSPWYTVTGGISVIVVIILPMASLAVSYGIILCKIRRQRKVMDKKNVRDASKQAANIGGQDDLAGPSNCQESKKKQNLKKKSQNQGKRDAANTKLKASEMKIIQTFAVVCGVFFICYLPILISPILDPILTPEQRKYWFTVANIFPFMNCATNPFIYVGMHATMRKRFLETIQFWKQTQ